jgi:hypothetical protein
LGDWRPDRQTSIRKNVFLWLVPAQISGRWRAAIGSAPRERRLEIEFAQRYQEISASAWLDGVPAPVWEARLESDRLSFVIVDAPDKDDEASLYFEGRVSGSSIEGTVASGVGIARNARAWRAERLTQR